MPHSILDVARELIDSPEAKTAYADDPDGFIAARGLDGLSNTDLQEAVGLVADAMPAPVARQLVAPPGPVADSLPLARVAAATSMDVAVIEAEPGTVDVTALVDPSGQLDLPTDVGSADAAVVPPDAEPQTEEVAPEDSELVEKEVPSEDETDFGRGALDETETSPTATRTEADEADEPDDAAFDPGVGEGNFATHDPAFDVDEDIDAPVGAATPVPGTDEEPPEDDFEDVII